MRVPFLDLKRQYRGIKQEIDEAIQRVLESQQFILGQEVEEFERRMAKYCGVKHAVGVASGTDALLLSLKASGISSGVITTPFTFFATAGAIHNAGAIPVFADVDYKTFLIDPESIEERITERTKGIICTHLFGLCCEMDRIIEIARRHNLAVIEDSCQAITATCRGKLAGTMGDIGVFSFEQSKHITSGDGGIAITNNKALADEMKKTQRLGWEPEEAKDPGERWKRGRLGWNFRMTELCGAVLMGQLEKLDSVVENHIARAESYQEVLKGCRWLVPQYVPEGYKHVYWVYPYLFEGEKYGIKFGDFQRVAKEEQAGMGFGYTKVPANMIPLFTEPRAYGRGCPTHCPLYTGKANYGPGVCPVAEDILPRIVLLQCEPEDLARVVRKIEGGTK